PYTSGHQRNAANLAVAIAKKMGLSKDRIEGVRLGASIHDIGKIHIPADILNYPRKLTENEYEIVKAHPQVGYEILESTSFPWPIKEMILQHHERIDGSGYPNGISGDDIIIEAKVLAVADVVDAMTAHRPYRPAFGIEKAIQELQGGRGALYDSSVVDACVELLSDKAFSWAQLPAI
ncbi:MAG: HD-GYP domain-containing protein, partial [Rhodospirillales bacterium]|nr:HD-GYP domain-containing protein [Rhodospirillales bacterium]